MRNFYALLLVLSLCGNALALETTVTPRLTLHEEYTDNLDRSPEDAQEDYITTISPGLTLGMRGATAGLSLSYNPTYATYKEHNERDTWRHYASLLSDWHLGRRTVLNLSYTLVISDDPADIEEGTSTVTRTRNRYMTNSGTISLTQQFGREDSIAVGYNQSNLNNEDELIEDSQRLNPYLDFTWWFIENRYGMTLHADYTKGDFQRSDDFDSYSGNLRLRKRLTRSFDAFLQYAYMQTVYEGLTENYKVHNPAIGFNYIAGEHTNISLAFGYGIRDRQYSEDDEGPTITGDIVTAWPYSRGTVNLHIYSGYTQDTFSTENLGFYIYDGGEVRADYGFTRNVRGDVFATYRYAKYLDTDPNIEDHIYTGGIGLGYQVLPWMRLRLEGSHRNLLSNEDTREYKENRAMLTIILEPATPYRWI